MALARPRASAAVAARLARLRELRKLPHEDDALEAEAEAAAGTAACSGWEGREDSAAQPTASAEEGVGATNLGSSGLQAVEDRRHEQHLSPLRRLRWRLGLWWHVGRHTSQVGRLFSKLAVRGAAAPYLMRQANQSLSRPISVATAAACL